MPDELPWDDTERLPALLRKIERETGELRLELELEYRIWRAHQPALRREVPPLPAHKERWPGQWLVRHLAHVAEVAGETAEALEREALT